MIFFSFGIFYVCVFPTDCLCSFARGLFRARSSVNPSGPRANGVFFFFVFLFFFFVQIFFRARVRKVTRERKENAFPSAVPKSFQKCVVVIEKVVSRGARRRANGRTITSNTFLQQNGRIRLSI
jgi:hypothetical protein